MEKSQPPNTALVWILRAVALFLVLRVLFVTFAAPLIQEEAGVGGSYSIGLGNVQSMLFSLLVVVPVALGIWYLAPRIGRRPGPAAEPTPTEPRREIPENVRRGWLATLERRQYLLFTSAWVGVVLFILACVRVVGYDRVPLTQDWKSYALLGVLLLVLGLGVSTWINWICPACGARLEGLKPRACRKCGLLLFDDGPAPR